MIDAEGVEFPVQLLLEEVLKSKPSAYRLVYGESAGTSQGFRDTACLHVFYNALYRYGL